MMPARIPDCLRRVDSAYPDFPHCQASVIQDRQYVATSAITENSSIGKDVQRSLICAGSLHPCFNGEVLQLQTRRIADKDAVAQAVETERLPHDSGRERGISTQGTVIGPESISGIPIPSPPAD